MSEPNLELYCHVMEEIKRRVRVVYSFINGESKIISKVAMIESACLQMRKILELIALASLVANKNEFCKQNAKFASMWNARLILADIERINPYFYPQPVESKFGDMLEVVAINDKSKFLTKEAFVKVYEKCGKMMHADNPFGSKVSYDYYENTIPEWLLQIMVLLERHVIVLFNDKKLYLIHIKDTSDGKVHGYTLAPYHE